MGIGLASVVLTPGLGIQSVILRGRTEEQTLGVILKAVGAPIWVRENSANILHQQKIGKGAPFDERWLQELVFRHPEAIPMSQIEPGLSTLIPVCMELPLRCGFLDSFYATSDGDLVIVEVKLWQNHEMRRSVMAQALDYASAMFELTYEELDLAVQNAEQKEGKSLYEIVNPAETLEERDFIDAVSHNLKTGRIVVLVLGDGIRSELENLHGGLQQHAGFQFTFGLVELSVYEPETGEYLLVPRTLATTHRIERGVVRVSGGVDQVTFEPVQFVAQTADSAAKTISSDIFFEAMSEIDRNLPAQLQVLLDELAKLGVYPEYKKSLILRWNSPDGDVANLGYIYRDGQVWTDHVSESVKDQSSTGRYLAALAENYGCEVGEISGRPVVKLNGKAPRVELFCASPSLWVEAIERFLAHK